MSIHKRHYKKQDGKISTHYLAVIKLKGLRPISKSFNKKIEAEEWEREQRVLFKTDPDQVKKQDIPRLEEFSVNWMENFANKRLEFSTVDRYQSMLKNHILPVFAKVRLHEISPHATERWLNELVIVKDLSTKSANNSLGLLKKMLNDAVRWRQISHNPIVSVRPLPEEEKEFDFWSIQEGEAFLMQVKDCYPALYYVTTIALYTGMRLGEIQALKWDAVDLNKRMITVKRTFCIKSLLVKERTKTKRIRRIPINGALHEILVELKAQGGEFVVQGFAYMHAARTLKYYAKQFGVKPIRFHDLRHSFASNFVMNGGELYKLQRLLGHSSIQMTERYSHLSPEHLNGATEILDFGTRKSSTKVIKFQFR